MPEPVESAPPPPPSPDQPEQRPVERPIPRGCHPLVFGIVMATIQLGATIYFMGRCSG
ncbi:MAG: hypothetical protein ACXW0Z_01275 [Gemmatirosa sp.]